MFTGLVLGTGSLRSRERRGPGFRLTVGAAGVPGFAEQELELGESIAVSGACLTVVAKSRDAFEADVSLETAEKTTLGRLPPGAPLNLERSLRVGDRLGGHWLSGHVDAVATVSELTPQGEAWLVRARFPEALSRFVAQKGSVALDGVSLTVNEVAGATLSVMLIPHTRALTTLRHLRPGSELNLEIDLLARYVVRYVEVTGQGDLERAEEPRLSLALERAGYK